MLFLRRYNIEVGLNGLTYNEARRIKQMPYPGGVGPDQPSLPGILRGRPVHVHLLSACIGMRYAAHCITYDSSAGGARVRLMRDDN